MAYKVTKPFRRAGKSYTTGDDIDLTESQAKAFVDRGLVESAGTTEGKPKAKSKSKAKAKPAPKEEPKRDPEPAPEPAPEPEPEVSPEVSIDAKPVK